MRSPRQGVLALAVVPAVVALLAPGTSGAAAPAGTTATVAARPAAAVAPATVGRAAVAPAAVTVRPRLIARPPVLTAPIVIRVRNGMGVIKLSTARDYRIVLPTRAAFVNAQGLSIAGGRNVVVIGGVVDVGNGYVASGKVTRRAAYLRGATGTVYIEGVRFQSSTQRSLTEGIDVSLPNAGLVLANVRIASVLVGSRTTNHADALQAWAGPARLTVDGFTAATTYQGFFLLPRQLSSASVASTGYLLRRVFLRGIRSGFLLWRDANRYPIRTWGVYVTGSATARAGLYPSRSAWPHVILGTPRVDFTASAGLGYRTPGYV